MYIRAQTNDISKHKDEFAAANSWHTTVVRAGNRRPYPIRTLVKLESPKNAPA